jgi:putative methionine-R-sulfoxide reductase with GAF domain
VKSYQSTQKVVADIEALLSRNRPSFRRSPLEEIAELLASGRHYSWVGIYLTVEQNSSAHVESSVHPAHVAVPGTVKKIVVSIKIAGRELGFLNVESDRENAFGAEDRVLLERVAGLLARFLTGRGKYLVLKARKPGPAPKAAAAG